MEIEKIVMDHYKWLELNLPIFFKNIGIDYNYYKGFIVAHGDKTYQYKDIWESKGIPFNQGSAMYLLTNIKEFSGEVRDTPNGWVAPYQWVIDNYPKFKKYLPKE